MKRGINRKQIMTDCSVDQLLIYHGNKKNLATEDTEFFFSVLSVLSVAKKGGYNEESSASECMYGVGPVFVFRGCGGR